MLVIESRGITLTELLIALLLFSLIATFAIPSFNQLIQHYRYQSVLKRLTNDLRFAKNYANFNKTRVSICNSDNGKECNHSDPYNWSQGWIIFEDKKPNFTPTDSTLIRHNQILKPPVSLIVESNVNIKNGLNFNAYRRYGSSQGTGLPNGHFRLCAKNQPPYTVIINIFGITRTEKKDEICPDSLSLK